ncbi:sulfatase-like hydrolase/transferase [Thalassotalea nanhaiensis]|uniref:Sulfatase-like hydrolase/transferase n=1 Tax=Thalassotalea nanhaiensis TaxID=3065648 RepID=A0ABY9TJX9_9GAMM|nr:sulfatase-like hydrolase/transferase [Colwelliaceae bacterium SQ345]
MNLGNTLLNTKAVLVISLFSLLIVDQTKAFAENKSIQSVTEKRPNIVFLLADDLGYGELGAYGQKKIKTPNLDKLATMGMRFTDFYAGNAVCAPSRAVLMTGKHPGHATIRGNQGYYAEQKTWDRVALNKDELTLGELMQNSGYNTAFIGKWHLGVPEDTSTWASARGFDYAVQEQWGQSDEDTTFDEREHWINGQESSSFYDYTKFDNLDEFRTNFAIKFLDKHQQNQETKEQPFFLFMSYRAPHGHEWTVRNDQMYKEYHWPEGERHHATKITLWDQQVGRLLDYLKHIGEFDNTLIVLTSDNGPHNEHSTTSGKHDYKFFNSNGQLTGYKRDLYEGGIRVPHIAVWANKIKPNTESKHIGAFQDFMTTFADVADVKAPSELDGISLLPTYLQKGKQQEHPYLYWEEQRKFDNKPRKSLLRAIRQGNWKAVQVNLDRPIEIYNLENDIDETDNLAKQYPEKVKHFKALFEQSSVPAEHFPFAHTDE